MSNKTIWMGLAVIGTAAGIYLATRNKKELTLDEKRRYLQSINGDFRPDPFNRFTDQEILDSYAFVNGDKSEQLRQRIMILSAKYKIFN